MTIEMRDDVAEDRYVLSVDSEPAVIARYRRGDGVIDFVHTETAAGFEGQGLAGKLVAHALDEARSAGLSVRPFCPYVRSYIDRHRQYLDLVSEGDRERFGYPVGEG